MSGVLTRKQVAEKLVQDEIIALTDEEIEAIEDDVDTSNIGGFGHGTQTN